MEKRRRRVPPDFDRGPTAVAMGYTAGKDPAPRVLAAGQGLVAEAIQRVAREHGVPVLQDPRLAGVLAQVEIGDVIPPELYQAVAEVLAFLWRLEAEQGKRR